MGSNYEITQFKQNLRQIANDCLNDKLPLQESYKKFESWIDWVNRRSTSTEHIPTHEHLSHLHTDGASFLAMCVANRRSLSFKDDRNAARSAIEFCLYSLCYMEAHFPGMYPCVGAGLARLLDPSRPLFVGSGDLVAAFGPSWAKTHHWPDLPPTKGTQGTPSGSSSKPPSLVLPLADDAEVDVPVLDGKPLAVEDEVEVWLYDHKPQNSPDGKDEREEGEEGEEGPNPVNAMSIEQVGAEKEEGRTGRWEVCTVRTIGDFGDTLLQLASDRREFWLGPASLSARVARVGTHTKGGRPDAAAPPVAAPAPASAEAAPEPMFMTLEELEWRAGLGVGSALDWADLSKTWVTARVVDVADSPYGPTSGDDTPAWLCVRGHGYNHGSENWVRRLDMRIAPLNVRSAGRHGLAIHYPPLAESMDERECGQRGPRWTPGSTEMLEPPGQQQAWSIFCRREFSATPYGRAVLSGDSMFCYVVDALSIPKRGNDKSVWASFRFPWLNSLRAPAAAPASPASSGSSASAPARRLPLPVVVELSHSLGVMADVLSLEGVREVAQPWLEGVLDTWLPNVTAEDAREVTRSQVEQLAVGLYRLAHAVVAKEGLATDEARAELLHWYGRIEVQVMLGLAAACLRSESILKRREGLLLLQDVWVLVQNRTKHPKGVSKSGEGHSAQYRILPMLHVLSLEHLVQYVAAPLAATAGAGAGASSAPRLVSPGLNLLHDVCVARHHQELVRQSGQLLKILAAAQTPERTQAHEVVAGALTRRVVLDVWDSCWRSAEEDARDGVAMLADTLPELPPTVASCLLELCLASGGTHWPQHTARLYETIATSQPQCSAVVTGMLTGTGLEGTAEEDRSTAAMVMRAVAALFCLALGVPPLSVLPRPDATVVSQVQAMAQAAGTPITHAVSQADSDRATDAFVGALAAGHLAPLRLPYMRICVRNIGHHVHASRCMTLLRRLVGTHRAVEDALTVGAGSGAKSPTPVPRFDLPGSAGKLGDSLTVKKGKGGGTGSQAAAALALAMANIAPPDVIKKLQDAVNPAGQQATTAIATFMGAAQASSSAPAPAPASAAPAPPPTRCAGDVTQAQAVATLQDQADAIGAILGHARALHGAARAAAHAMSLPTWADRAGRNAGASSAAGAGASEGAGHAPGPDRNDEEELDGVVHGLEVDAGHGEDRDGGSKEQGDDDMGRGGDTDEERLLGHGAGHALAKAGAAVEPAGPCILSCLSLLGFLLSCSRLSLSPRAALGLWDEFVGQAVSGTVRRAALAWFTHGAAALAQIAGPVGIAALQRQSGNAPDSGGLDNGDSKAGERDEVESVDAEGVAALRLRAATPPQDSKEASPKDYLPDISPIGTLFPLDVAQAVFGERLNTAAWAQGAATGAMDHTAFVAWRTHFLLLAGRDGHVAHAGARLIEAGAGPDAPSALEGVLAGLAIPLPPPVHVPGVTAALGPAGVVALSAEPPGLDTLWSVALNAQEPSVASAAVYLLTALQPRASGPGSSHDHAHVVEARMAYMGRSLKYLQAAVPATARPSLPAIPGSTLPPDPFASVLGKAGPATGEQTGSVQSAGLADRCVALLTSVLDGAEDEACEAEERLLSCVAAAVELGRHPDSAVQAALAAQPGMGATLQRARVALLHSTHGGGAGSLLDPTSDSFPSCVPMSGQATVQLRIKVVGLPQPKAQAKAKDTDSKDKDKDKENVPMGKDGASEGASPSAASASTSADTVITKDTEKDKPQPQSTTSSGAPDKPPSTSFTITLPVGPMNGDMVLTVAAHESLRSVRARLACALGLPTSALKMVIPGSQVRLGRMVELRGAILGHTLSSILIRSDASLSIMPASLGQQAELARMAGDWSAWCTSLAEPAVLAKELNRALLAVQSCPGALLASSPAAICTLMSVVDSGLAGQQAKASAAVWGLLCRLPTAHTLVSWAETGQACPASLWPGLLSYQPSSPSLSLYLFLLARRLALALPLAAGVFRPRAQEDEGRDEDKGMAASVAFLQVDRAGASLLGQCSPPSAGINMLPRLASRLAMSSRALLVEAGHGADLPEDLPLASSLSLDAVTWREADSCVSSFLAARGPVLLLTCLASSLGMDKAGHATHAIASLALDMLQRVLVQALLASQPALASLPLVSQAEPGATVPGAGQGQAVRASADLSWAGGPHAAGALMAGPTPQWGPDHTAAVHDTLLHFLASPTTSTTSGGPLRLWSLLQAVRMWGILVIACPGVWQRSLGSSSPALASILSGLLSGHGAAEADMPGLASGVAGVLHTVALAGPGTSQDKCPSTHEWLMQLVLSERPRPGQPLTGALSRAPAVHQPVLASIHYALAEALLQEAVRRMGHVPGAVRPGQAVVLPADSALDSMGQPIPRAGDGHGPVLPPRLALPASLRSLLVELATDIRTAPALEGSLAASIALRHIEEEHRATVENPDGLYEDVFRAGWRGHRTAEEVRMGRALAARAEEVQDGDDSLPGPSALPSLSSSPVSWASRVFTTARLGYLEATAGLYTLAPMHEQWAWFGWDTDSYTVIRQAAKMVSGSTHGLGPGPTDVREYVWRGDGGQASSLTNTDGTVQGHVPDATLACVLAPRPYDSICTVPGVDTRLQGCLRLATVLVDADPVLGAEVGTGTGLDFCPGLVEVLFKDTLFGPQACAEQPVPFASLPTTDRLGPGGCGLALTSVDAPALPKTKTLPARRAAFGLLRALVRRSTKNSTVMLRLLSEHVQSMWFGPTIPILPYGLNEWRQQLSALDLRAPTGYAGLRNQGCTCYMNSLLQQFYMMEGLRYGVLAVVDATDPCALALVDSRPDLQGIVAGRERVLPQLTKPAPNSKSKSKSGSGEDMEEEGGAKAPERPSESIISGRSESLRAESFLYQLQRVFAGLEMTGQRAWNPHAWLAAYKDLDGQPTNPTVQQDAQEFLTTFLDRLEYGLKATPRAGLVQAVLGCETKEVRACSGGCGTVRTSVEPAVCLTVEVAAGNLEASLAANTAWEEVPGYACEACARRTTLRKRNTLGKLSDTVILHLKRFQMNYETEMPTKINTRFAFPTALDLYPYSYEALAKDSGQAAQGQGAAGADFSSSSSASRESWKYELVGVVVHMGNLDSGHYYSYIKERGERGRTAAIQRAAAKAGMAWTPGQEVPPELARLVESARSAAGPAGVWMEFNDSSVTEWDPSTMESACFGGGDGANAVVRSAYMLVYERVGSTDASAPGQGGVLTVPAPNANPEAIEEAEACDTALARMLAGDGEAGQEGSDPKRARMGSERPTGSTAQPGGQRAVRSLLPRDASCRGPLPASLEHDIRCEESMVMAAHAMMDTEMGATMLCLADTVSRQAGLLPMLAAQPCPLPPLPVAVPLLDGDGEAQIPAGAGAGASSSSSAGSGADAVLPPEVLMRGLLAYGVSYLLHSAYGAQRTPAPPAAAYFHSLARIIGARQDAAMALLRDIVAGEQINEVNVTEYLVQDEQAQYQTLRNTSKEHLPPLTGRMSSPTYNKSNNRPEDVGWLRAGLVWAPSPILRSSVGRLVTTALLRVGLPSSFFVQALDLWPVGLSGNVAEEPTEALKAQQVVLDPAHQPRFGQALEMGKLAGRAMSLLSQAGMWDLLSYRFHTCEATTIMMYDIARGGFGCGLPLPLPMPHAGDPLGVGSMDKNDARGHAEILQARRAASTLWARGVTMDSALVPLQAHVPGVHQLPALPLPDLVYRAAAVATSRLRITWAMGRGDLRAALLSWLLQLDMATMSAIEAKTIRLTKWVPPPPALHRKSTFRTKDGTTARLARAYDTYALLARSCAPFGASVTYRANAVWTTAGITPVPPASHSPLGLLMALQAGMDGVKAQGTGDAAAGASSFPAPGSPPVDVPQEALLAALRKDRDGALTRLHTRDHRLNAAGTVDKTVKQLRLKPEWAKHVQVGRANNAGAYDNWPWQAVPDRAGDLHPAALDPDPKGDKSGPATYPALARVLPVPCAADVDLMYRSAVRTAVSQLYEWGSAGQKTLPPRTTAVADYQAEQAWELGRWAAMLGHTRDATLGHMADPSRDAASLHGYTNNVLEYAPRGLPVALPPWYEAVVAAKVQYRKSAGAAKFTNTELDLLKTLSDNDAEELGWSHPACLPARRENKAGDVLVAEAFNGPDAHLGHLNMGTVEKDAARTVGVPWRYGYNMEAVALAVVHTYAGNHAQKWNPEVQLPLARLLEKWCEGQDGVDQWAWQALQVAEVAVLQSSSRAYVRYCAQAASDAFFESFWDAVQHANQLEAAKQPVGNAKHLALHRLYALVRLCSVSLEAAQVFVQRGQDGLPDVHMHMQVKIQEWLWDRVQEGLLEDGWTGLHVTEDAAPHWPLSGSKPKVMPQVPAWLVHAIDPTNTVLQLPPALVPSTQAVAASYAADPTAAWRAPMVATLVGPLSVLTVRDEAVTLEALSLTVPAMAMLTLARMHPMLQTLRRRLHLEQLRAAEGGPAPAQSAGSSIPGIFAMDQVLAYKLEQVAHGTGSTDGEYEDEDGEGQYGSESEEVEDEPPAQGGQRQAPRPVQVVQAVPQAPSLPQGGFAMGKGSPQGQGKAGRPSGGNRK